MNIPAKLAQSTPRRPNAHATSLEAVHRIVSGILSTYPPQDNNARR